MILPWEEAVVVATGLPRVCPERLVVDAEVVVVGQVAGVPWLAVLVIAARRPSGFVPYCTGWSNLHDKKRWAIITTGTFIKPIIIFDFSFTNFMGFIGHGLGGGGGSGAE